jgi:hypothetical protein
MQSPELTFLVLSEVEKQLDERIKKVTEFSSRLERTKRLLHRGIHGPVSSSGVGESPRPVQPLIDEAKEVLKAEDNKKLSSLDEILSLAREVRSTNLKKGKSSSEIRSLTKTSTEPEVGVKNALNKTGLYKNKSQTLREALAVDQSNDQSSHEKAYLVDILEQLAFLSRYKIPSPIASAVETKALFIEKAKFMTAVTGRPCLPNNLLFSSLRSKVHSTTIPQKDPVQQPGPCNPTDENVIIKLAKSFKSLIVAFERYMKQRIDQTNFAVENLSADDRTAMISMWYRGRKLLELYDHYVKTSKKLPCYCTNCRASPSHNTAPLAATSNIHGSTAMYTPLPVPSAKFDSEPAGVKRKDQMKSNVSRILPVQSVDVWNKNAQQRISMFHSDYQQKVKFAAESIIGKEQLKDSIAALRKCCEDQTKRDSFPGKIGDQALLLQWTQSLKQYKFVYSMLLCEAHDTSNCMFLNK